MLKDISGNRVILTHFPMMFIRTFNEVSAACAGTQFYWKGKGIIFHSTVTITTPK